MARTSKEVWAKRVERWQASDLTAKEFAAEIGVKPSTLSHWKWMLGKESGAKPKSRRRSRVAPSEAVSFTELAVEPTPKIGGSVLEVVVDARRVVRVDSGFDAETLARVLDVLEARS